MKNKDVYPKLLALATVTSVRFPGDTALSMIKNKKTLMAVYGELEVLRTAILEKHAEKDDAGVPKKLEEGGYDISVENTVLCNDEYRALMDENAGVILMHYKFTQPMADMVIRKTPEISMDEIEVINGLVTK